MRWSVFHWTELWKPSNAALGIFVNKKEAGLYTIKLFIVFWKPKDHSLVLLAMSFFQEKNVINRWIEIIMTDAGTYPSGRCHGACNYLAYFMGEISEWHRSSRTEVFYKKVLQENNCAGDSLLIKLQASSLQTY